MNRLLPETALARLSKSGERQLVPMFRHGSLEVEFYKPHRADHQKPHSRDEIYVIVSGSGFFVNGSARQPFQAGEVLFVPAGVNHRFEDFSDDFATWVFFYGPEGGEPEIL